ncbi:hypothetical protein ABPG77_002497 [Micractinium sp. CCAP 211/92]
MSAGLPPPDYTVNEAGERIIAASKRPDGTIRKERRVRAGYVPQEEQQVYVSRGTAFRQNVPKCPGFDESSAEPAKPKSKSAAKNAKRKEKRQAEQAGAAAGGGSAADAAAAAVQSLSLGSGGGSGGGAAQATAAAAAFTTAAEEPPSVEKQIKKIKKKVQQAEALAVKKADGAALSAEEEAKLDRLAAWQEELRQLEAQL